MLDEVNLAHPTCAKQALDHVPGEFLTGVQRHVQEPTNQHRWVADSADEVLSLVKVATRTEAID